MNCVVTAGPTYEPLDEVRRLTNFSTGRLGSELAAFLTREGHSVTLLIGQQASYRGEQNAATVKSFTTTANLSEQLEGLSKSKVDAVFHAAAVSDFRFGNVFTRSPNGDLKKIKSGKIPTREGELLAELVPTAKIIADLRRWFPQSLLVGWKYEVEGNRDAVVALAQKQIAECRTDACVANGRGYGPGFGLVTRDGNCAHFRDASSLYSSLGRLTHK
jgi:phosphopantothenate---cysteine ligase (CTP)